MLWRVERITSRFLAIVVSTSALLAMVVAAVVAWWQFQTQRQRLDAYVADIARLNVMALTEPLWTINDRATAAIVGSLSIHPEILCAEIVDPGGQILASNHGNDPCGEIEGAARIAQDVVHQGHTLGTLVLWTDRKVLYESARSDVARTVLVFLLLSAALAVTAVFVFRTMVMHRLDRLLDAIRTAAKVEGDPYPQDELGRVVTAYNRMLERIDAHTAEIQDAHAQAVAAAQAKSRFLATMSHEIRTPMHGVLGTVELLRETPLLPDQRRYADIILHSTEALLGIINDILDLSKIEAGKVRMLPAPANPTRIAQEVVGALTASAQVKGIDLELKRSPGVPGWIFIDPQRLRQIVMNLVGNAVKFTEQGVIRILLERRGDTLAILVSDTGIGIAPEVLPNLFQPFQQADDSTTRRHGGTGLGLSISSQLAELMGGSIMVASALGRGSTFTVLLPIEETPAPVGLPEAAKPHPAGHKHCRILAAEDNPVNQWLLRSQLGKLGYQVDIHPDGRAALAAFAGGGYGAVVTDYHMPVMDGHDLARAIRAAEMGSGRHIPIIGMTADAFADTVDECLRAGMDEVVTKPVSLEELGAVLLRLTGLGTPPIEAPDALAPSAEPSPAASESVGDAADQPPLLDPVMLEAIFGGDHETLAQMAQLFAATADDLLVAIRQGLADHDATILSEAAHSLASAALSLGATRLGTAARALEHAIIADEWGDAPARIEQVTALNSETRHALSLDSIAQTGE